MEPTKLLRLAGTLACRDTMLDRGLRVRNLGYELETGALAVHRADDSIEHLRLPFRVEVLFKPRTGSHRRGRKIEEIPHDVVNRLGSTTRVNAAVRHAASLENSLARSSQPSDCVL